jgi:hypothetical protein
MYELTDRTRGHTIRSRDILLIVHLQLLWLLWGHIVTLSWVDVPEALSGSPTLPVPRASRLDRDTNAAAG